MSKCPDAQICESLYGVPLKALQGTVSNTTIDYIGSESPQGELKCKHLKSECVGNIQQLCARHIDTKAGTDPKAMKWFDFVNCQSQQLGMIPNNGEQCAKASGLDWAQIQQCSQSYNGLELLSDSFARTQAAGVSVSCTVFVNNSQFCQHNGDWVQCDSGHDAKDLKKFICDAYKGDKPSACN